MCYPSSVVQTGCTITPALRTAYSFGYCRQPAETQWKQHVGEYKPLQQLSLVNISTRSSWSAYLEARQRKGCLCELHLLHKLGGWIPAFPLGPKLLWLVLPAPADTNNNNQDNNNNNNNNSNNNNNDDDDDDDNNNS